MPKGKTVEPTIHENEEEAKVKAEETKRRHFVVKRGKETYHVVAGTRNAALTGLCAHKGDKVVSASAAQRDPVRVAKKQVEKMTPEQREELLKELAAVNAPAVS